MDDKDPCPQSAKYSETALIRTLRDIADGHVTLWLREHRFDPATGRQLESPVIATVPDRSPAPGVPADREWWLVLAERGWIAQPARDAGRRCWQVTPAGHERLRVAEPE